jgi:hypothetical protein
MNEAQIRAIIAATPERDEDSQVVVHVYPDRTFTGYLHSRKEPINGLLRLISPYDDDSTFIDIAQICAIETDTREDPENEGGKAN